MTYSIATASDRSGLSTDTLRYYERIGLLLEPPDRDTAGRRSYTDADLAWLEFLTKLRTTGMPIRLMREYAALCRQGPGNEARRLQLLLDHRAAVRQRMAELDSCLAVLDYKIGRYAEVERSAASALDRRQSDRREEIA